MPSTLPPGGALRLLDRWIGAGDRDAVIGDLLQQFHDRVDAGRRANRAWFWLQTLLLAGAAMWPSAFVHREHWSPHMEPMLRGVRQAGRRLRHDWRFACGVVLILAAGLGPAAAMLSVVETVLLRPLDYSNPEQLAMVRLDLGELRGHPGLSPAEAIDLRRSELFAAVEVQSRLVEVSMAVDDRLVSLSNIRITTGMLPMLGVVPAAGRLFTEDDIPPPGPQLAPGVLPPSPQPPPPPQAGLLDFDSWQTHFGGDSAVLNRVIQIDGRATEIVGILPRGFRLATGRAVPQRVDLYTPLRLTDFRNAWQFPTIARLPEGRSLAEVQAPLDGLAAALRRDHPDFYPGHLRFTIAPLLDDMTRATRPALRAAVAAVLLLLFIACANATALILARARSRERDLAIQQALGAGRSALAAQVLIESAWLGAAATLAGGVLAAGTVAIIRRMIPRTVPRWDQIDAGWSLLAYAGGLAFLALTITGLLLVWRVSRTSVIGTLRSGSIQGGRAEGRTSRLLLAGTQIALTLVLAFGCAQLARSAANLRQVDPGFDANVLTLRVPYDLRTYDTSARRAALYQRIRDRVARVPGVTSVGVSSHVPLSGSTMMDGYEADLAKEPSFAQAANYQGVARGYFETLRVPIIQGRDFTDAEDMQEVPVVVVDETLIRTVFPGERDVIGRPLRLGWGLENARIIGVVGHVQGIEIGRQVRPQIYSTIGNLFQVRVGGIVIVRTSGDAMSRRDAIESAIREVGPGRAVGTVAMLSDNVDAAMSTLLAVTGLVSMLATMAGALSAVGLYVVIAFIVHEQRRSAAIRTALGATRNQVVWSNVRPGGVAMIVAVGVGLGASLAGAPLFADLLYGVSARDAGSLAGAVALTALVGAMAMYVPARRAARANIVAVLRE